MMLLRDQIIPDFQRAAAGLLQLMAHYLIAAHMAVPLGRALRAFGLLA